MARVVLTGLTHRYPSTVTTTIDDLNLDVPNGELLVILGGTGSGKTTLLRLISGMETPTAGTIAFDGEDVTKLSAPQRHVVMAFENYALYPHMTVAENMAFALLLYGETHEGAMGRVRAVASRMGLQDLLDATPDELTGTQRHTVAMARAAVRRPAVFLLDEPMGRLPHDTREETTAALADLQRTIGITAIVATRDTQLALDIADRIAVLENGRITRLGTPDELRDFL
ncbi:ABC transporter ATP-binding protein [Brevibacterium sp. Marseille-P9724]|uniref:ABC transporter ATP-binding protein n=1 Tax=Brevibacterium sp. Marseille-P9724 TaxID=2614125 RepID=UPI00125FA02E|nr:ABC transporter ATP-binding protein [Brevibacterium sp. Marseille-P9724]